VKQKFFVDGEVVRAEAEGATVYLVIKQKTGGTWRVAVREQDIRRVLRGRPYDEGTAAFAARRLHRRWVRLSSMQSPSRKEARERRRERKMKVTLSWVLKKDVANLEASGEDAKEHTEWDAWTITKDLSSLKDEDKNDFFAEVSEVSKDQVILKPRGGKEAWDKQSKKASDKDDRLQQAIDAVCARPYVFKLTKVQFGQ